MSRAQTAPSPVIELRNVSIRFEEKQVLDGLSFRVTRGETKIVLGASGEGKSVLIKLVAGLTKPEEGEIWIFGKEITQLREEKLIPIRKNIGIVFQESALFDSLDVRENVAYRLIEEGLDDAAKIEQEVLRVLEFVELQEAINKMPAELSGGMKRRVAIARALIANPKIMLYDEPTAGLDPITARTIVELILELRDLEGVSSVLVTHRLTDAFTVATERVSRRGGKVEFTQEDARNPINASFIVLRNGKIVFEGSVDELIRAKETDEYLRTFLA